MKILGILSLLIAPLGLWAQKKGESLPHIPDSVYEKYSAGITEDELHTQLHFVTSDFFRGRKAGSSDERAVATYLASYYQSLGIPSIYKKGQDLRHYFQEFSFPSGSKELSSQNVLAYLEGIDPQLKQEVVVLVAHYDHLGVGEKIMGDSIYNGAADDGSGTVALLEIAEALMEAYKSGVRTKRSILFLHTGAEESGLHGSIFFVNHSAVPLEKMVAVINLDGVAGTDKPLASNAANYVYLLQNDSTSSFLRELALNRNKNQSLPLEILAPDNPQHFNSDNKPFEYELIPSLYFSTGLTEHYHQVSDEASAINYAHMTRIVRLVFALTCDIANDSKTLNGGHTRREDYIKTGSYFCVPCGCPSDTKVFPKEGSCPDCRMNLYPTWTRQVK